jgi:hypothetical protein
MTNFDLYKLLNFVVNKDVYAQAMSEGEFDLELKAKNIRHFRSRLGLPEGYKTGAVTQAVETTRINQHDLAPFLITETDGSPKIISVSDGKATISGVSYILDFYTDTSRSSDIISYQEISSRLRDPQTAPTTKDLAAYIIDGGLRVYPSTVTSINVIYYREPITPVFMVLTNSTTLEMEYDSASSTELEWDDGNKLDIMHMILGDMGINISRAEVSQYATKLVETGK